MGELIERKRPLLTACRSIFSAQKLRDDIERVEQQIEAIK